MRELVDIWVSVQTWIFQTFVGPVIFQFGLMEWFEAAFNAVEFVMLGVVQITVIALVMRTLEKRWPLERASDNRLMRTDQVYTALNKLGVIPLAVFTAAYPITQEIEHLVRAMGMAPPRIERIVPWLHDNALASFLVYFALYDFAAYWVHRAQHRFRWWWALHSLHHSQRQMTFWADDRNHLLDDIIRSAMVALAALIIGVPSGQFFLILIATRMIQSLSHANVRVSFGWLGERVLVSPKFHRAHHAIGVGHEGAYRGCNFAVLFPLWDIVFRTANFQSAFEPTGIRDQLDGRDYGIGFWRQQWLGLIRLKDSFRLAS